MAGGFETGAFQGHRHAAGLVRLIRVGEVAAVGVGGIADHFREHGRTAGCGMFVGFQHQGRSPLADHQPVAVDVERPRRGRRFSVAGAGGQQRVEHRHVGRAQFLGAAGHHHVLKPVADGLVGVADPLAARRAGRAGGDHAPRDAEEQADVHRRRVAHHAHVAGGIQPPGWCGPPGCRRTPAARPGCRCPSRRQCRCGRWSAPDRR